MELYNIFNQFEFYEMVKILNFYPKTTSNFFVIKERISYCNVKHSNRLARHC